MSHKKQKMKVYKLEKKQQVKANLDQAWDYFSTPLNLSKITPSYMNFEILSDLRDGKMYPGQIIQYKVRPIANIPMSWTTEITHVIDKKYFVDEQRFGPYSFWHHQHWFEANDKGVLMTDIVHYALPLGLLGRIANSLFVAKQLEDIFEYRFKVVDELFNR